LNVFHELRQVPENYAVGEYELQDFQEYKSHGKQEEILDVGYPREERNPIDELVLMCAKARVDDAASQMQQGIQEVVWLITNDNALSERLPVQVKSKKSSELQALIDSILTLVGMF
jgi:hypothetical protein